MGYCVRCGGQTNGNRCLKCRNRSVVSIATALDSIGRGDNTSLENGWGSRGKGPSPKVSSSTPIGTSKPRSAIVDRHPLPLFARPMTNHQGAVSRDTDKDHSASTYKESLSSSPTSPVSPLAGVSNIQNARSALSRGSVRNSSFFSNLEKAVPGVRTNGSNSSAKMVASYSTSTAKPRPSLNPKLFFHDPATSAVSSPVTPNSPTLMNWPSTPGSDVPQHDNAHHHMQKSKELPSAPALPTPTKQSGTVKKDRICCRCNEPLRRGGKGSSRRIGVPPAAGSQEDYAWYHAECLTCPVCTGHFSEADYFVRYGNSVYHPKCQSSRRDQRPKNETKDIDKCTTCAEQIILGSKGNGFQHKSRSYHFKCAYICYTCQDLVVSSEPRKESQGKVYCTKCVPSISPPSHTPHRRRCVSSGAIAFMSTVSSDNSDHTISPSDLLRSNRRTALPKLGGPTVCPRCNKSTSVMDVTRGPRASYWHKKCLVCANPTCKKPMDSDANVTISDSGQWLVHCRGCMDKKNRRRSSYLQ